jgi:hypothetical protein
MSRKHKMHLYRSTRSTWCGRDIQSGTGWTAGGWKPINPERVTHDHNSVTCGTCVKANAAEQRKEDEASRG